VAVAIARSFAVLPQSFYPLYHQASAEKAGRRDDLTRVCAASAAIGAANSVETGAKIAFASGNKLLAKNPPRAGSMGP